MQCWIRLPEGKELSLFPNKAGRIFCYHVDNMLSVCSYNKSAAQMLLKWSLQQGLSVLPKSLNPKHIKQNLELDFSMTDADVDKISALFQ